MGLVYEDTRVRFAMTRDIAIALTTLSPHNESRFCDKILKYTRCGPASMGDCRPFKILNASTHVLPSPYSHDKQTLKTIRYVATKSVFAELVTECDRTNTTTIT